MRMTITPASVSSLLKEIRCATSWPKKQIKIKVKQDHRIKKIDSVSKDALERVTRKNELSTNVLDERQIVIVDSSSGTPLAQGVAYLNQKGKIIKIKLAN